jgi:hypothetical protein
LKATRSKNQDRRLLGEMAARLRKSWIDRIVPGSWTVEIPGRPTIHLGSAQQQGTQPYAIEFSFLILAALARPPGVAREIPLIVTLLAPSVRRRFQFPSQLITCGPTPTASLHTNRHQFTNLMHFADAGRLHRLSLEVAHGQKEGDWAIKSWSFELHERR